ncbi:MAG: bifunctional heptose 7-phosphate kinase/heptose 1-phosphate adenyltransferase [Chlamydiia bacterium]
MLEPALFSNARILVLGDFIIDHYVEGVVERISPEAPVPVLKKNAEEFRLGGAANVAVNCCALGATTYLLSITGPSSYPYSLANLLKKEGLDIGYLVIDPTVKPIIKTRFMSEGHHILRLDDEEITQLSTQAMGTLTSKFSHLLQKVDIVVFSDYAKGFFHPSILQSFIRLAKQSGKKILVDPKGVNYAKYQGCYLIKPNQKEAYKAANCELNTQIEEVASFLLDQVLAEYVLITRSAEGMALFDQKGRSQHYPTSKKEVVDVVGAGDTALALIAVALASGQSIEEAVMVANIGSSIVVSKRGCASVTIDELQEAMRLQASFDFSENTI